MSAAQATVNAQNTVPPSKNRVAQNRVSMIQTAALKSARLAQSNRSRFRANLGSFYKGSKIRERETDCFERMCIKYARPIIHCIQGGFCTIHSSGCG